MTTVLQEKVVAENANLKEEIKALIRENDSLKAKIVELEDKLGLNSQNSSLPPSRDIYRKKAKKKSDKKPGGQPGHKVHKRELMAADEVVRCTIDTICMCGGKITLEDEIIHQKAELPEIKPIVTEYRLQRGHCRVCNKRITANLPEGVARDFLGPNAKTVISSLSGFFINSKREVQQILGSIFNLNISLGLVSNTERRVSKKCASEYEKMKEELQGSEYLHIDETGHRNQGKRGWSWVITNKALTLLKVSESRGKKVLKSLLPEYDGIFVSDRYAVYNYFNRENRQICWAHLARDFERFAHSKNVEVSKIGQALKSLSNKVFVVDKAKKQNLIDNLRFYRLVRKIRKRVKHFLRKMTRVANSTQASRMAAKMLRSEDMMWKFLRKPEVIETTNNLAERQIRRYVIYRKNSFFTWSKRGERFVERMLSIFLTSRLNGQNPFQKLQNLVAVTA
ncbi:IS66 family transposase [Wolbachia endosymbiont of Zygogramma bicolorata]|uniref:IS66 family transposase n=1 Tax=Wolbachia endosymbiont of Zygogramma bicolorata TaxID=3134048 RepID=UPI003DA95766